ncbi:S41 family peptidase [Endozoicomonas sp. Mp262]|uniref:S41 family peptidase n=1 Tax=Endozoicomonas sp. Mp262 TaxID=2919499 RepID=UPI0021E000BC
MMPATASTLPVKTNEGYYRFPALHDSTIVFTAEGDLWTVNIDGGLAQRLTSHQGVEADAAVSPDGMILAFKAQYEGSTELYTMPLAGGLPRRLTFHGISGVVGWTPDGKILYRSYHLSTLPNAQLFVFDPKTQSSERLPLAQAADGRYDETGKTLFFTRLPFQGSYTKRYQGGSVEQIWKFTQGAIEAEALTQSYPGTSSSPMWWNNRVYFVSDRDGIMNLWSMDESGGTLRQHTFHKGWDIKSPSLYKGRVVYQLGADLHLFDIDTSKDKKLSIQLASDFDQLRDKWVQNPLKFLSSMDLSPDGDRLVLTSRGRVFVIPVKQGRLVEVTRQQGIRFRNARFMPDGKNILLQSDHTGEVEFWTTPADGHGSLTSLTEDGQVLRNAGVPSPDGKWIVFTDHDERLWLQDLFNKKKYLVDQSETTWSNHPSKETDEAASIGLSNLAWSPDSRWLAYAKDADNGYAQIFIYSLDEKTTVPVTTNRVYSFSPAWSQDGQWLYFLSDRNLVSLVESPWGQHQPEPFFDQMTKVYQLALQKDLRSPFKESEEFLSLIENKHKKEKEGNSKEKGESGNKNNPAQRVKIDFKGIQERLYEVPIPAGNYEQLQVTGKHLYIADISKSRNNTSKLVAVEIKNSNVEKTVILEDISHYVMSMNQEKILIEKENALYVIEASGSESDSIDENKVDLSRWAFSFRPREEWRQIFIDAWRMERDYFYDVNLHGIDWKTIRDKHFPLVERVTDRDELDDLIGHIVGELGALHTFISDGDKRQGGDNIAIGFLGAELVRDSQGQYHVGKMYRGDPDYPERLSPLQRAGLGEGDIIEAINGIPAIETRDLSELLRNQAKRQVRLTVRFKNNKKKKKDVIVVPFTRGQAYDLRYDDWEFSRRERVEAASDSNIGYIHLRAMGADDIAQWVRDYYPVFNRKGLIIDVRHNRGGNIDSWILEKLMRRAWFFWKARTGKPHWNMQYAFRGHMVVLCDEETSSDGEVFVEGFRRLGLGKVIGTRTWGGNIWLNLDNRLVDNGIVSAPQLGVFDLEGKWLIEGHGVEPDIMVDNLPHETFKGKDAQLDAAINYLKNKIAAEPVEMPEPPSYPVKTFKD